MSLRKWLNADAATSAALFSLSAMAFVCAPIGWLRLVRSRFRSAAMLNRFVGNQSRAITSMNSCVDIRGTSKDGSWKWKNRNIFESLGMTG